MNKKIFLDTNILLSDFEILDRLENYDIYISSVVLKELDGKKSDPEVGYQARQSIKKIEVYIDGKTKPQILSGVDRKNGGRLFILDGEETNNDDIIIKDAVKHDALICSNDRMVRIKSSLRNVKTVEYEPIYPDNTHREIPFLFDIFEDIEAMSYDDELELDFDIGLKPNEFFIATDFENTKKFPCVFVQNKIVKLSPYIMHEQISPKNTSQLFLMYSIRFNPVTIALGPAGTGKTICALASAIHMVTLGSFDSVVLTKPISHVGKELGFLPGDMSEKLDPYYASFIDALDAISPEYKKYIFDNKHKKHQMIQYTPLTYLRGRTLTNSVIILDEAQNTNRHEMKTFLSRIGKNCKVIILGDDEQIDIKGINRRTNGLTLACKVLENQELVSVVYLDKQERSDIADLARLL